MEKHASCEALFSHSAGETWNDGYALGGVEPSVAQPPLPLQLFLALQPLSPALQPPVPLHSFLPLQECLSLSAWLRPAADAI